jgi:hypothetical protein
MRFFIAEYLKFAEIFEFLGGVGDVKSEVPARPEGARHFIGKNERCLGHY